MCILLSSTEHPDYPFILLSNRDEFFNRPTKEAHFRQIDAEFGVISPLDLARSDHGTWIGVNTQGKLAALVNFRERDAKDLISEISRGLIPIRYLCSTESDDEWYVNLTKSLADKIPKEELDAAGSSDEILKRISGFSLLYGQLKLNGDTGKLQGLNIMSNKGGSGRVHVADNEGGSDISTLETFGLSNSLYTDPWNKVHLGQKLLHESIAKAVADHRSKDLFLQDCFDILSHNTYNMDIAKSALMVEKFDELRNSIFIPPLGKPGANPNNFLQGVYGTRTQTVILLEKNGNLNYYERDVDTTEAKTNKTRHFEFKI